MVETTWFITKFIIEYQAMNYSWKQKNSRYGIGFE